VRGLLGWELELQLAAWTEDTVHASTVAGRSQVLP
jgi:hypothetical protein